jgi:hypothetical protein
LEASERRQREGKQKIDDECDRKMAELDAQIAAMKTRSHDKVRPIKVMFNTSRTPEEGCE